MAPALIALAAVCFGQTATVTPVDTFTAGIEYPARLAEPAGGGIYVTDPVQGVVQQLDASGAVVNTFAVPGGPVGIAVHSGGNIYVSRNDGAVGVYDAAFTETGTLDPTPLTFTAPNDMVIHPTTGELFVTDSGAHRVLVFDGATGAFLRAWGVEGYGLSQFQSPQAIAIDPTMNHVIVADVDNFRIQVFDTDGLLQFKFGYRILYVGSGSLAWFARSEGLAVDSCGNIYVADALMGTVRVFSSAGVELDETFTPAVGFGTGAGELRVPCDLMINGADQLYVASTNNAAIEVFDVACVATPPLAVPNPGSGEFGGMLTEIKRRPANRVVAPPDNPADIVDAMNEGIYDRSLDLNRDRSVNLTDLEIAVESFGAATVEDFLAPGGRGAYPDPFSPPHMLSADSPFVCGRCHSMDGLPGGMLAASGQENLCLSCHNGGGLAKLTPIPGTERGLAHPLGVPAAQGDVEGPNPDDISEMVYHLDDGDIRCATCHDPHEQTAGEPYLRAGLRNADLCGECHRDEGAQWMLAGHADEHADPWLHYDWSLPNRAACRKCHSGNGFIDFSNGLADADQNGAFRVADCAVCHGVHGTDNIDLLRIYDDVTLPGDATFTDQGADATCMTCHNGRRAPDDGGTPHYALGGVMLEGINGNEFGETIPSSPHTFLTQCTDCHMAPTPADGEPGAGKVGGHTFAMKVHDADDPNFGFENVENACNSAACHGAGGSRSPELLLTTFNREAFGDYDGDGAIEGVQDEVQGLKDSVFAEILATGAVFLGHYPYWDYSGVVDDPPGRLEQVQDVVWNWEYVDNSGDLGIHNTGYAVGLLQVSYKVLTGADVPGAFLRYGAEAATFPATVVEITGVNGGAPVEVGGAFTVDFTIEDDQGTPIDIGGLDRLRLYVSGPSENYQRVIEIDSDLSHFAQNPDGTYTYTAVDPFPAVYAAPDNDSPAYGPADGELTGQPLIEGTYTVLIESRQVFGSVRKAGDATLDFVVADDPGAPPALASREVVTRGACNECHTDLQIHGSNRYAVTGCVICHTAGAEDLITDPETTPGVSINLAEMIHKVHQGHALASIEATANGADPYRYEVIGYRESVHDFSDVGFPIIPEASMKCGACHDGAAQGGQAYTAITRSHCSSCHDDLDFTTGTILDAANPDVADGLLTQAQLSDPAYRVFPGGINHTFADDTTCSGCHGAGAFADVAVAHTHPTDAAAEGTNPMIEIVSVGGMTGGGGTYFQAGDLYEVTFRLMDDTANPLEIAPGDLGVLDRLYFIVAGPTTLYQTIVEAERPWNGGNLSVPAGNWIDNFATDGTYTFISEVPWPVNYPAQLNALGEPPAEQLFDYAGGWGQQYTAAGTPLDNGTYSIIGYGRRITPTDGEREPVVTDMFNVPFGAADPIVPYAGTVDTASCNACHGRLAFHGNQRWGLESCLACHTAGTQDGGTFESVDLRIMVHKLHNARNLVNLPYEMNGHGGIADFSHLLISSMPGEAAECQVCHVNDDWKSPPLRDNMRTWMVACTSCHDGDDTAAHANAATMSGTFVETCTACHGEGTPWSIEKVHATP